MSFILPEEMPNDVFSRWIRRSFMGEERVLRSLKVRSHPGTGLLGEAALILARKTVKLATEPPTHASMDIEVLRIPVFANRATKGIYLGYLNGISQGQPSRFDLEFQDLLAGALRTDEGKAGYVFGLQAAAIGHEGDLHEGFAALFEDVLGSRGPSRAYLRLCNEAFGLDMTRTSELEL